MPHLSRSYLRKLIDEQRVLVAGSSAKASRRLTPGESISVYEPEPRPAEPLPESIPIDVVYEDEALVVIDKPAGLVVHPAPGSPDGTLVNALLHHCRDLPGIGGVERPGIVHRLDRNTSGLLVVAKSDRAQLGLREQFDAHTVGKHYLAFAIQRSGAEPLADAGRFDTLYGRHPVHRKRFSSRVERGKRALTDFTVLQRYAQAGCTQRILKLRLSLHTGRTHQIRVHLSDAGHPVLGDKLYGGRSQRGLDPELLPDRQALHACRLELVHPLSGERMVFESQLPRDLQALEEKLRRWSRS
ncbi:MAG: RluA family pseudouridine synthase [Deltaproteobacteria bacterium]|nr:RluA family pseudouridine synthase [Deltaproteobacteria bacterium]